MTSFDMTPLRKVLEDLVLSASTVRFTRDHGVADDELDEVSGELTPTDPVTIYTGIGAIQPVATGGNRGVPDLDVAVTPLEKDTTHRCLLPTSMTADIYVGDMVKALTVNPNSGDASLVGLPFEVSEVPNSASISAARIVFLRPRRAPLVQPDEAP